MITVQTSNAADAGTHTVTVKATLTDYSTVFASQAFTLTLKLACPSATLSYTTSPANINYTVGASAATGVTPVASDTVSVDRSTANFCGAYTFSIDETITGVSINASTGVITVSSTSLAAVGTHSATVKVGLSDYASVAKASASITITIIDPCLTATLSWSTSPSNISYIIG